MKVVMVARRNSAKARGERAAGQDVGGPGGDGLAARGLEGLAGGGRVAAGGSGVAHVVEVDAGHAAAGEGTQAVDQQDAVFGQEGQSQGQCVAGGVAHQAVFAGEARNQGGAAPSSVQQVTQA